ncbi:ABC transporter ATP-binding protein [Methyloligella sp. 2.7D]|uniref:iron ABC transporter ATP-binding protein n=1 Tax=unclassified Methyloligella TaxID=2625955 RepID=UPI00157C8322|nr:ABC transporter ATP-binding protein [Methyloligella sp. GL2]QKP78149.1 ABC transporter ATP-binding protein [Methyloligella sp. GL2]
MIEVSNVSKRYGETLVLDEVSVQLPAGKITSIIGPNGAGKSTLVSIMGRLLPMDAGHVLVDGLDVTETADDVLARHLSILRQENQIVSRLTVRDLVAFGRYPYTKGRPTVEDREHIAQALSYLQLEPLAGRFLDELSGGQRQRAFIAMVLCQDTKYVLLDEPLNNLDMKHAVGMMKLLKDAAAKLGKTFVLVLHDINFASCYSDHIVALRDGKLAYQGTPEEIMQPDVLAEIYDLPIDIHEIGGHRIGLYFT